MLFRSLLLTVASAASAFAAVISHDAVVSFPQSVPSNSAGNLMLAYKPYLLVINGCVPFPAVDTAGNTGGGLQPTGSSSGGCSSSVGQVYARAGQINGYFAIMYSWYMPKDSPTSGFGHRHDWENAVVFLSSSGTDATFVRMVVSAHGEYTNGTPTFSGTNPYVGYSSVFAFVNHQLIFTNTKGGMQPLIAWEQLTPAARTALQTTDFGDATVPFKDSNFQSNLQKAYDQAF